MSSSGINILGKWSKIDETKAFFIVLAKAFTLTVFTKWQPIKKTLKRTRINEKLVQIFKNFWAILNDVTF